MSQRTRDHDELTRFLEDDLDVGARQAFEERASRDAGLRSRLATVYRQRQAALEELPVPPDLVRRALELGAAEAVAPCSDPQAAPAEAIGAPVPVGSEGTPASDRRVLRSNRFPSPVPTTSRRLVGGLVAAAALMVVAGAGWWLTGGPPASHPLLDDTPRAAPLPIAVELKEPPAGAQLASSNVELRWEPVATATGYIVDVVDDRGDLVARAASETPGCHLELPAGAARGGETTRTLYWCVTARLPDGSTLTSELRSLIVALPGA